MICNAHVPRSVFFCEFNENIFRKLRSHNGGPGVQVHEGLGYVHHVGTGVIYIIWNTSF